MAMRLMSVACVAVLAGGCAGYTIQKDGTGEGYDVYRPEPYLLVTYPPGQGPVGVGDGHDPAPSDSGPGAMEHPTQPIPPADRSGGAAAPEPAAKDGVEAAHAPADADKADKPAANMTVSVVYLPDYSERYRIHTYNVLAKADFTFKIDDGWKLTSLEDKGDNTAVVTAVTDLAKAALGAAFPAPKTQDDKKGGGGPAVHRTFDLYKVIFADDGHTVALLRVEPLTLTPPTTVTRPVPRPPRAPAGF